MKLNYVQYDGWHGGALNGAVAYAVYGRRIIFTTLIPMAVSGCNAADDIVIAICQREQLDWRSCQFVEIRTSRTYPKLKKFENEAYLLNIEPGNKGAPVVMNWMTVGTDELPAGCSDLFDALPWYEETPRTKISDIIG